MFRNVWYGSRVKRSSCWSSLVFGSFLGFCLVSDLFAQAAPPRARQGGPGIGGPPHPHFNSSIVKLFGDNSAFTANMEVEMKANGGTLSIPGKLAFLDGKSRFEMDTTKMKAPNMPAAAAEQMKQMGMAEIISIMRPDKKENYMVYPGLKAYALGAEPGDDRTAASKEEFKKTEDGKETVDGHSCTRYKVTMKDDEGKEQQATVWSASDLKGFPVKIETVTEGHPSTMTFKDVKLAKPDAALFDPPADYAKYTDVAMLMRDTMMKRFAPPGGGVPAPAPNE